MVTLKPPASSDFGSSGIVEAHHANGETDEMPYVADFAPLGWTRHQTASADPSS
jgi:hypothetical protein